MEHTMRFKLEGASIRLTKPAAVAMLWGVSISLTASATTFSLSENWSNTADPNGPWSYRQGSTDLPLVPDWTAGGSVPEDCDQPARAPSNQPGDFLPAFMKTNACTSKHWFGTDPHNHGLPNAMPGDIVVHTVDSFNGNPALGAANVLFKLPAGDAGRYQISGSAWDASLYYGTSRPQDWVLLVNGIEKEKGFLSGDVSRSEAESFNIVVDLSAGDTVELELFEDAASAAGFFVGLSMNIKSVAPECTLTDAASYDATTGMLTTKFTIGTPSAASWNVWLLHGDTFESLGSKSLPITEPPVIDAKKHALEKSGEVGILSTLTTPAKGITCSSWETINTEEP